jgi:hypothetical protein
VTPQGFLLLSINSAKVVVVLRQGNSNGASHSYMLAQTCALLQTKEESMATADDSFIAFGPSIEGIRTYFVTEPVFDYGLTGNGVFAGAFGRAGGAPGPQTRNDAFFGVAGVHGESSDFPGAAGTSIHNIGVYGQTEEVGSVPSLVAGVYGTGNFRSGVFGWSSQNLGVQGASFLGTGVQGTSFRSPGIQGQSGVGTGVQGTSLRAIGVTGISGTQGPRVPNTSNIAAVLGTSDRQHGVIGATNANVGVIGFSTNNIGVLGFTTAGGFAGFFLGNLAVTGTKAAVVPFPDGTQRALYCMESPELWFEDFGAAKLKDGRAVVKLDADFAKVIKRGDYKVFLAPEGDCRGLYVRRRGTSFEVRELMGGKSSIAFSYRIVGRRRDIQGHRRFAKIDTRLPLPAAARPARRKPTPTTAELRAFIARLEKEAEERRPKGARKVRRLRASPPRIEVLDPARARREAQERKRKAARTGS